MRQSELDATDEVRQGEARRVVSGRSIIALYSAWMGHGWNGFAQKMSMGWLPC
jgi:hypothetical protein